MRAGRWIITLLWLGGLMPGIISGQTLSPRKALGRYQQFVWTDQDGLPQNGINAIARTRDGYLWLGTFEGAARFDGVRFTVFDSNNTREIYNNQVLALLEDRRGNLWLGTNGGGLLRYAGGHFTPYTTRDGLSDNYVYSLLEDRQGNLWIGTYNGGLNRFRDGRFTSYTTRDGLPGNLVWALTEDREGVLWVGTDGGLARFKPNSQANSEANSEAISEAISENGRFTTWTVKNGLPSGFVRALWPDRAGNLWVGLYRGGLCRFRDGRLAECRAEMSQARVSAIYEDRQGNLWIGTNQEGLFRFRDDRFIHYPTREGLPGESVVSFLQDPQGDLWIGTLDDGLCQFRDGRFGVYTAEDGLPHNKVTAVYEDSAGSIWLGTINGLGRFRQGSFTAWTTKDGLPFNAILSLSEDLEGSLWLATAKGIARFRDGRFTTWTTREGLSVDPVRVVLADRAGNVWVGTGGGGLNRYRDGRFTNWTTRDGLADDQILSLYEDRSGSIWIGTLRGGVSRFKDGRFTTWTTKDGLASNHILSFYEDRRGSLWIGASDGGLSRFRDGKFATIALKDGLYDNLAFQILSDTADDSGDLWMSCNRGIYRVSLRELNDFADGRIARVNSHAYGTADGMLSRECNQGSPAGWKTRDGRLWFPTVKGVVVIDPRKRDAQPPLVTIEQVRLDGAPLPADQPARIRPGQENLEIEYTGLNWSRPQQIKFRYQMVGLDQSWVEAGTRRTAYYPHLPPGAYTFKVIADNGEGVWNTEGQSLRITALPPFYRTWWFLTLIGLGVAGVVFLGYEYRVRQLRRAQARQQAFSRQLIESQESERKRIAAELHDSLGQNLLIIKNRALLGQLSAEATLESQAQFDQIAASATQSIEEVREIAQNLRPYHLDRLGLTEALEAMIEKVAASTTIRFVQELIPLDGLFSKEAAITLYRVVQESLNNVVKHAQATEARISVERQSDSVTITIRDNGRGFAPKAADAKPGGFGLAGMAERVRILGGELNIHSGPGQGTTVTIRLSLPGSPQGKHHGQ